MQGGGEAGGGASAGDDVRAAVRSLRNRGVDVIKVMGSGGRLTLGSNTDRPQFNTAEMRAVLEEAHNHGLPVTVHAYPARFHPAKAVHGTEASPGRSSWPGYGSVQCLRTLP